MDSKAGRLVIAYAGELRSYAPVSTKSGRRRLLVKFKNLSVNDVSTRSGYYLLEALARFRDKFPDLAASIHVDLWGMIEEGNKRQVESMGLEDMVSIGGYLSRGQSLDKLRQSDILFLPLESKGQYDPYALPGKLYEYLRTGKPVLALADASDCTEILQRSGLGIICPPRASDRVAETLKHLVDNRSRLPELYKPRQEYIDSSFKFEVLAARLASVFEEVLDGSSEFSV